MNPSATGTIAVQTELAITEKLASSLRAHDRLEGAEPLVADRLDEPPEVRAPVGGPAEVDEREGADRRHRRATPTGSTVRHREPLAEHPRGGDPDRGHQRQHAADVGPPDRHAVDEHRDHEHAEARRRWRRRRPASRREQEPAQQEGGPGVLAVGEVAHPGEAPADRRRVAEHGVELERRADEHVDREQAEDRRPGRGAAGRGGAPRPMAPATQRRSRPPPRTRRPSTRRAGARRGSRSAGRGRWRGGRRASSSAAQRDHAARPRGRRRRRATRGADPQRGLQHDERRATGVTIRSR